MAVVGLSFSPFDTNRQQQGQTGDRGTVNPVQDAIKVLSFRQPTVLGSQAPVAPSLFSGGAPTAQGSQLGGSLAENWLRMLFGGQAAGQPSPFGMPQGFQSMGTTGMGGMGMSGGMGTPPQSSALPASVGFDLGPGGRSPDIVSNPALPSAPTSGMGTDVAGQGGFGGSRSRGGFF